MKDSRTHRSYLNALALAVFLALAIAGCGGKVDDGHAFLLRYAPQWQAGSAAGSSFPYATPAAGSQPDQVVATGSGLTRPNGLASPDGNAPAVQVYLDPGHGGVDEGSSGTTDDGRRITEKAMTLAVAQRTARLLRAKGITVALSREDDSLPGLPASAYTADGKLLTPEGVLTDLQRRIDRANASGARVLLSIHFNAYSDPAVGGSETFYDPTRRFGAENQRFANLIQNAVIRSFHQHGYDVPDRGVTDDTQLQTDAFGVLPASYNHLVLLGPAVPGQLRASQMPGALSEPLFLTDADEVTIISQPAVQDLLARAYADAIEKFLAH